MHPYEDSAFKKMLIEKLCCKAGVRNADKDTNVNKTGEVRITKGTSEFVFLCLFITP